MAERLYDEDEIREILTRATELAPDAGPAHDTGLPSPGSSPGRGHGLTLAELEEVGTQAGILPTRIVEAAAELELTRSLAPTTKPHFGVPLTASHVVGLPRLLTEDEWDRFVVLLRDSFGATGVVRTEGSLQTWSNGNLKVLLEPLAEGARLRFQSMHDASKQWVEGGVAAGVSGGVLGALLGIMAPLTGKPIPLGFMAMIFGFAAAGAGMWAFGRSKAAAWLPTRENHFKLLGAEARRMTATGSRPAQLGDGAGG